MIRNLRTTIAIFLKKYKKTVIIIAISLMTIFGYQLIKSFSKPSDQQAKVIEVHVAKRSSISQTVEVIGTIRSKKQTTLSAKSKGILQIVAKSGDFAKKGELIARIDNDDIEKNYKILKEAEEIARIQLERAKSLLQSGISSKTAIDEKKSTFLEAQKRLSDAKIALEDLKIYAPFDGTIGFFKLRDGSELKAGDAIVTFYDPESLLVEFDVPLAVAKQINATIPVLVNNKEYKLTYIQKMLDEETHMCPAYVEINCSDCIIGTVVDVLLVVKEKTNVITVPFEAIFLKEAKPYIYIAKDSKAVLTAVEPGIRDKTQIEIKSGLNDGDQVVVYGHSRLYPDALVKIHAQDDK